MVRSEYTGGLQRPNHKHQYRQHDGQRCQQRIGQAFAQPIEFFLVHAAPSTYHGSPTHTANGAKANELPRSSAQKLRVGDQSQTAKAPGLEIPPARLAETDEHASQSAMSTSHRAFGSPVINGICRFFEAIMPGQKATPLPGHDISVHEPSNLKETFSLAR
jgi:hypothetical protein